MLILAATTDKFQLQTLAASTIDVHATFVDLNGTTATPGKQNTAITTVAVTDILAAPAASTYRNLKALHIRNRGAVACDVVLWFDQNAVDYDLFRAALNPGDTLVYAEGIGFVHHRASSNRRAIALADQALTTNALTLVSSSALDAADLKVGTILKWQVIMSKNTTAGLVAQTFGIYFGTNGTTADTLRVTGFTTGAQTAVADVAEIDITLVIRSVSAAGTLHAKMELAHNLAATGFAPTANVVMQLTPAAFDMTVANLKASLGTTAGQANSVTIHQVNIERIEP